MTDSSSSTVSEPAVAAPAAPRALYAAMAISSVGSVLNNIALLAYLYQRTSSPLPVGAAVLLNFLPVMLLVPLIGSRITPASLRLVASGAAFGQAAIAAVMAFVVASTGPLAVLFVGSATLGVLTQLLWISILSLLPKIVDSARLASANVTVQLASQAGAVVGALALVGRGPTTPWVLFAIDAATFVIQGIVLRVMLPKPSSAGEAAVPPDPALDPAVVEEEALAEPGAKPRLTMGDRGYALLMPVGFIALNLLNVAIPLIVLDRLGDGQRQYAMTETVYPIAAIVVGVLLRKRFRVPVPVGMALIGAAFLVLGVADSLPVLLVATAIFGTSIIVANAATQTLVQTRVAGELLPRVQSLASAFGAALSALSIVVVTGLFDRHAGGAALAVIGVVYLIATPFALAFLRNRTASVNAPRPVLEEKR